MSPQTDLVVSVVIPTYARPKQLRACLGALTRQTLPPSTFEVIVVDDGSPEPLDTIVAEFAPSLQVRLFRQENAGPSAARNVGARQASAPLLAFTDDDCLPGPEWLENLLRGERETPGALVGGSTVNGLADDLFATTSQFIIDLVYEHFNADPLAAYFFASNNMLCRRDRLLELGGFDGLYHRAGAEDRDFCDRWRAAGLRLVWRRDATIEHRHAQSLREFCGLHFRYGRGAHVYQSKRRERGTGTMHADMGFHLTLPGRVWKKLGRPWGVWNSIRIGAALVLWQVVNAAGFAAEALTPRTHGAGSPSLRAG